MSKYLVDLTQELNAIRTTPYGKTMRPNLADAIEKLNKRHNALSETFDNLVIDAGNSNAEVVDARNDNISQPPVNHQTLGGRLDAMQQQISNTSNNVTPIIQEVEQARGPHNNLNDRLNGIDNKFNDYLPLTGGDITGDLEVNGNLTTGGHQVWHEGNLIPDMFPAPETVVKRNISGNINSYNAINLHDRNAGNTLVGTHMGSITLNPGTRTLYHGYIPPGNYDNPITNYQIHTQRDLPTQQGAWTPIVGGTGGGTMNTSLFGNAYYYRIGNLVFVSAEIVIHNAGNAVGNLTISGLPFRPGGPYFFGGYIGRLTGLATNTANDYYPYTVGGNDTIRIWQRNSNNGNTGYLTVGGITPTAGDINLVISTFYHIAI